MNILACLSTLPHSFRSNTTCAGVQATSPFKFHEFYLLEPQPRPPNAKSNEIVSFRINFLPSLEEIFRILIYYTFPIMPLACRSIINIYLPFNAHRNAFSNGNHIISANKNKSLREELSIFEAAQRSQQLVCHSRQNKWLNYSFISRWRNDGGLCCKPSILPRRIVVFGKWKFSNWAISPKWDNSDDDDSEKSLHRYDWAEN